MGDLKKIGACWSKSNESGFYLAGNIQVKDEQWGIFLFKSKYKKTEKHPDFEVFLSKIEKKEPYVPKGGSGPDQGWKDAKAKLFRDEPEQEDVPF